MITISTNAKKVARDLNISARELRLVMDKTVRETGKATRKDFERITRTWEHDPEIYEEYDTRGGRFEALVGTDDKIFNMLEHGTRPHIIRPRRAKVLRFMSGFRPKTQPGNLFSGQGGSFGNPVFRPWVMHPGTQPRRWMPKIQRRTDRFFKKAITRHLRRWARKRRG